MKADWTLEELGSLLNGKLFGKKALPVRDLSIDSRTPAASRETLFIALTGEQHDGHNYITALYQRGIRAFLVSRMPSIGEFPEAGFCMVVNTLGALQQLASQRRRQFKGEVLAIFSPDEVKWVINGVNVPPTIVPPVTKKEEVKKFLFENSKIPWERWLRGYAVESTLRFSPSSSRSSSST